MLHKTDHKFFFIYQNIIIKQPSNTLFMTEEKVIDFSLFSFQFLSLANNKSFQQNNSNKNNL